MRGSRWHLFCLWSSSQLTKCVKRRVIVAALCAFLLVCLLRWKFICTNVQPLKHIQNVCTKYINHQAVGNLCGALCQYQGITSLSCHNFYQEKETVFSGTWGNMSIVFKAAKKTIESDQLYWRDASKKKIYPSEDEFAAMIKTVVKQKFNIEISDIDARKMSYIEHRQKLPQRYTEMENVWSLVQDNEYLALTLYEKFEIFPKLIGTCGSLYGVQKLNTISGFWHLMTLYDSQEEWVKRIRVSIMIMDFLNHLETGLPESLLICNVKMNHFGVTDDFKKIMYLDLDSVHPIVCERVFLGWVMSGRVMVPGLLVGPHTPRVLIELLELCANPAGESGTPRAATPKDIRKRLYDLLVHLTY